MYAVMHAILLCVFPFKVQYANPKSKEKPPLHFGGFSIFSNSNSANLLNTEGLQELSPKGSNPEVPRLETKAMSIPLIFSLKDRGSLLAVFPVREVPREPAVLRELLLSFVSWNSWP